MTFENMSKNRLSSSLANPFLTLTYKAHLHTLEPPNLTQTDYALVFADAIHYLKLHHVHRFWNNSFFNISENTVCYLVRTRFLQWMYSIRVMGGQIHHLCHYTSYRLCWAYPLTTLSQPALNQTLISVMWPDAWNKASSEKVLYIALLGVMSVLDPLMGTKGPHWSCVQLGSNIVGKQVKLSATNK